MSVAPSALRKIPLFANITDEHLGQLVAACKLRKVPSGTVLFEAGSVSDHFLILTEGEISLREGAEESFRLKPIAPVGELGALAKLERRTTAVSATAAEVLEISVKDLMQFFEDHGDVAFPFHYNLIRVVADKIRRDTRRTEEMRKNLMTTQKAMKRMRDALLEGEDTPLNKQLYEELEVLIEQNKKGHYLVEPAEALPTSVRLDDGSVVPVHAMSKDWLHLPSNAGTPKHGAFWSGVLLLPEREIAVSGTVDGSDDDGMHIRLDMLIDDYNRAVEDHLTRLQMLDFVL
ncbi:MAG: Crp/Fnr family transcriptional regulator [Polyangiaceae bacterium]|nr:Crp/Fnr family transcriptional regulator [Polyangiaceae bacterium]MCL4749799.1 Crp/Fnr family transcriptional regulator [Myxococcales bacterium]